jgi:hypothetical protein
MEKITKKTKVKCVVGGEEVIGYIIGTVRSLGYDYIFQVKGKKWHNGILPHKRDVSFFDKSFNDGVYDKVWIYHNTILEILDEDPKYDFSKISTVDLASSVDYYEKDPKGNSVCYGISCSDCPNGEFCNLSRDVRYRLFLAELEKRQGTPSKPTVGFVSTSEVVERLTAIEKRLDEMVNTPIGEEEVVEKVTETNFIGFTDTDGWRGFFVRATGAYEYCAVSTSNWCNVNVIYGGALYTKEEVKEAVKTSQLKCDIHIQKGTVRYFDSFKELLKWASEDI